MASELLKDVYETPRACVRGVFLCEEVAVPVSVLTGGINQEDWTGLIRKKRRLGGAATRMGISA
jgi:hypothetical protein